MTNHRTSRPPSFILFLVIRESFPWHIFVVMSIPDCDRNQRPCGAPEQACFSWCCWLSPGQSPQAPDLASLLHSHPVPHPTGPPPGHGHMMYVSHGAGRPALPPGRNTGFRSPAPEVTPTKRRKRSGFSWGLSLCNFSYFFQWIPPPNEQLLSLQ